MTTDLDVTDDERALIEAARTGDHAAFYAQRFEGHDLALLIVLRVLRDATRGWVAEGMPCLDEAEAQDTIRGLYAQGFVRIQYSESQKTFTVEIVTTPIPSFPVFTGLNS